MDTRTITITKKGVANTIMSHNESETIALASSIASELHGGDVIALSGELGAGKTAFVKGLANALGICNTVTSPTFVVMKVYRLPANEQTIETLCHVDAYRLSSGKELEDIGIDDYMGNPVSITVIEWAERVKDILPKDTISLHFSHVLTLESLE